MKMALLAPDLPVLIHRNVGILLDIGTDVVAGIGIDIIVVVARIYFATVRTIGYGLFVADVVDEPVVL